MQFPPFSFILINVSCFLVLFLPPTPLPRSIPSLLATTFCHPLLLPPSRGADKQLFLEAQLMPSLGGVWARRGMLVHGKLGVPHGEQNKSPLQSAQQPPALGLGCRLYLQIQIWFTAPCQTCAFFFFFLQMPKEFLGIKLRERDRERMWREHIALSVLACASNNS